MRRIMLARWEQGSEIKEIRWAGLFHTWRERANYIARLRRVWEVNIKVDPIETECEVVE
jgi:hypothetical protein